VLVIRRVSCISTISAICHSVGDRLVCNMKSDMSLYVGDRLVCRCTLDGGHLHRVTCTIYRTSTTDSPDDEHRGARNMWRIRINICKEVIILNLFKTNSCTPFNTHLYSHLKH
jgi:hypothetical protein